MNFWKRLWFDGAIGARAGAEPRTEALGFETKGVMAGVPCWIGGIMTGKWSKAGTKQRAKIKGKELFCLPNGLTELLSESI